MMIARISQMFAIGVLEHDSKTMQEQAAWFRSRPELQHEILSERSDAEAFVGHLARARALTRSRHRGGTQGR
jgi:hypothetical protein